MAVDIQTPSPFDEIDQLLETLNDHNQEWADLSIRERIDLLEQVHSNIGTHAQRWVEAAVEAKQIPSGSPWEGEEWASGPWACLYGIDHLIKSLKVLDAGKDLLSGTKIRTRADGQVIVRVHPADIYDQLLLNGVEAEVWMQPEVTRLTLKDHMAEFYREENPVGKVALVLGAGNIAAIAPLDVIYKLYAEGQVCILKMNPVNDYLGPILEDIFEPFVARGFLEFAYGGVEVGKYLSFHDIVEEIHITGSERTHDAIVFGVGDDAADRKKKDNPLNPRRVTSELGGVGPTIIVPGPWSDSDIAFQAEHVVTQKMHNGGFNCVASQVLVLPETWDKSAKFMDALRKTFNSIEPRAPYYPGAMDRLERAEKQAENAEHFGDSRLLITDIPSEGDQYEFSNEFFCGVLAQTSLPGDDAEAFLRNAIDFANDTLHGTLGCNIIIHPKTMKKLGSKFEDLVAELRYGTIGINSWVGAGFLLGRAPWGAFPGHERNDIQSGVGVVHNALLFDKPQKTVVKAPFRQFPASIATGEFTLLPRPPWFATNEMAGEVMMRVSKLAADDSKWKHIPGIFAKALRG